VVWTSRQGGEAGKGDGSVWFGKEIRRGTWPLPQTGWISEPTLLEKKMKKQLGGKRDMIFRKLGPVNIFCLPKEYSQEGGS